MGSLGTSERRLDSICIVGAGPSGLAAAKYLIAEKKFSRIVVVEQRNNVGGLWNHSPCPEERKNALPVPQTEPQLSEDQPVLSPIYDLLETNIPRGLMGFSDKDWPPTCQLFPEHETVLKYLESYAADILHLVCFETKVTSVSPTINGQWLVKTQMTTNGAAHPQGSELFDAVVVASGHFDVPYVPKVKGIGAWSQAYPGSITHSKFYRHPSDFAAKKVVVVGNSASGIDIGTQISSASRLPLIQSQKSTSFHQPPPTATKLEKPEIAEFVVAGRQIRFADGSVESDVDSIVYCTGYFYSYPFLRGLQPSVVTSGEYVENLYQHIFYRPRPTLAFVALNQKVIPFPISEAQAAAIARVWAGRLHLPPLGDMEQWEQETLHETGGGRNFHVLQFPKDADYINMLHDWAMSADWPVHGYGQRRQRNSALNDNDGSGSTNRTPVGREPPFWGEKEYWTRERFPEIKKAFQSFGKDRHSKRTLEDVGFDYDKHKQEKAQELKRLL